MTFQNSIELLKFHSVAYSIYALMIISIVAWFGYNLAKKEKAKSIIRIPFYGYIAFLVIGGVGHHIFTYNTIPWVQEDMMKDQIKPDKVFHIQIKDHKWILPKTPMVVNCGKPTLFNVTSGDSPMLPQLNALYPALFKKSVMNLVVELFPFVPVIATILMSVPLIK